MKPTLVTNKIATDLLDQRMQQRRDLLERDRLETLKKIQQWLDQNGLNYGIQVAYVFGSLTRPGHFHDGSDVDVAVAQISPEGHFYAMGILAGFLQRDVDLIELSKCPFQQRIRETGIKWTAPHD